MELDRRLVKDVEHADETRADLRREPDALALAAREAPRSAIEREVVESDVGEETQPLANFLENEPRDLGLLRAQPGVREELDRLLDRHRCHFAYRFAVEADEQAFLLEPRTVAGRARPHVHVRFEHLADAFRLGLLVAAVEPREHALERPRVALAALAALIAEFDFLIARALQDRLAHAGRDRSPRLVEAELVMRGERVQHRLHIRHRRPRRDGAVRDAQFLVLNHQLGIEVHNRPDARTLRHAPCGLLKENMRGVISGYEMPHSTQAKRWLK